MFKAEDHLAPASAKQKGRREKGGHGAGMQHVSKVAFVSPTCQAISQPWDTWAHGLTLGTQPPKPREQSMAASLQDKAKSTWPFKTQQRLHTVSAAR